MYKSTTISAQLLVLADRLGFGKICSEEKADKRYRHFTARTQFYAMMIAQLTKQKGLRTTETSISFVTRNKSNIEYEVISSDQKEKTDGNFTIKKDEIIRMRIGQSKKNPTYVTLRQVISSDNETGKVISLLTNMFDSAPLEIASIYKKRWEVELFFKSIKQNLHVKRFYGQSENAVKTQIWIALIVHLLFLILKAETRQDNRTFSSFCSEISVVLFKHRSLEKWFSRDYEKSPPKLPPDKDSLWLFDELVA